MLLALLLLMAGLAYKLWQSPQVTIYKLEVINQSAEPLDYIRLFGSGADSESIIESLLPGHTATVAVSLREQGELKFEVSQAGSRIDTLVSKDVAAMVSHRQRLHIYPNRRYIVSDYEGLLSVD